jgi:hypothetical protein
LFIIYYLFNFSSILYSYISHDFLKAILAQWLMVWVCQRGVRGVPEEAILRYMKKGPADKEASDGVRALNSELLKLMNLCHNWLQSLLPHIIAKINRVSFGLLSKEDLERQLAEDPRMPKTRKFLAVPVWSFIL